MMNIYHLSVSMVQEFGSCLAEWFWLEACSHDIGHGYNVLTAWLGLEELIPRWCTHRAFGRRFQVRVMCAPPQRWLSVLKTWQLTFPRVNDPRRGRRKLQFPSMTYFWAIQHHFHCITFIRSKSLSPELTLKGRRIRFHFLIREVLKNIWTCFKTITAIHLPQMQWWFWWPKATSVGNQR